MIKSEELANPNSCLNKARNNEMLFVLLARDPAAPAAIRAWIAERKRLKAGLLHPISIAIEQAKQEEAERCIWAMELSNQHKHADNQGD